MPDVGAAAFDTAGGAAGALEDTTVVEDEDKVVVDVGEVVVVVNLVLIVVDILSNIWLLFSCAVFCFQSFL